MFSQEVKNESETYIDAPWIPTFDAETITFHQFQLKKPQSVPGCNGPSVVRGCEFVCDPIDPITIYMEDAPDVFTGKQTP